MRRRQGLRSRDGWRRIKAELDALPGQPPEELAQQKENAERNMAMIDYYSDGRCAWRALFNEFAYGDVMQCIRYRPDDPKFARFAIERKRGKAV
jgi:hypothetical protein